MLPELEPYMVCIVMSLVLMKRKFLHNEYLIDLNISLEPAGILLLVTKQCHIVTNDLTDLFHY